jgi:hypothetical protein
MTVSFSGLEMTTRLAVAGSTCAAIPTLVVLAYLRWRSAIREKLSPWRNGAGLTAMFVVFALWLVQATRWVVMSVNRDFAGFLGPNLREVETFLPAFYAYPALPLAFALKGSPRLQMVAAWCFLGFFYGAFTYV